MMRHAPISALDPPSLIPNLFLPTSSSLRHALTRTVYPHFLSLGLFLQVKPMLLYALMPPLARVTQSPQQELPPLVVMIRPGGDVLKIYVAAEPTLSCLWMVGDHYLPYKENCMTWMNQIATTTGIQVAFV